MSVCEKRRRKIIIAGKKYIWYVTLDDDTDYNVLHIVSDDKYLILTCPLQTKIAYVISKGRIFQTQITNGVWNRYLLPFEIPDIITPKFVEKVIDWATRNTNAISINANNVPV